MNHGDFQEQLAARAGLAGILVDPELSERLEAYFRLMVTWNRRINLTALDLENPEPEVFDRILVEPLAAARHVPAGTASLIDIGSGGGSPAIPLALAISRARVRLVESRTRKSVFLKEASRVVGLQAEVFTARYEELLSHAELREAHDLLTLRAVRLDAAGLENVQQFVRPGGQLFLFRGRTQDALPVRTPELGVLRIHPLLSSLGSRLVVLRKR